MMTIGILPTLTEAAAQRRRRCRRTPATRCSTSRSSPRAARTCTSRSTASSGSPSTPTRSRRRRRARASSCTRWSTRRCSARTGTPPRPSAGFQLALGANSPFFLPARAVAGDPHPAVRAGHRHAPGGAQGPGRAPARVVRRALDHVDLRPLRGERPLLPGAAAGGRGRGPDGGAARPAARRTCRSCGCTTARSTAGTARSTRSSRDRPHLRVENRVLPAGPTIVDTLANAAFYYGLVRVLVEDDRPVWTQMSFSAAEENFHAGARDGIEARAVLAGRRRGAGGRADPAPAAADGPRRPVALGRGRRRRRPAAGDRRAPLRRAGQRRVLAGRRRSTASTSASTASTRCAR